MIETAADKLGALAWRVQVRQRGSGKDDPNIIWHLHDFAALKPAVAAAPEFHNLVLAAVAAVVGRGGEIDPPTDPDVIFKLMLRRLDIDPLGRVSMRILCGVSYAALATLFYADALAAANKLTSLLTRSGR